MVSRHSFLRSSLIAALALAQSAVAQNAPVRVLVSNGMKAVVLQLQPGAEKAIGHPLQFEFGSTTGLLAKVDGGTQFDLAILTSEAVGGLAKQNKTVAATLTDFARCGIGLAVRKGAAKPDISTPAAMKQTLQKAASISYAADGASRNYIDTMLVKLGIADEMKAKATLTQGSGAAMAAVAEGKIAIVMTLISELLPIPGIEVVGPFPADLQKYVRFGAAVGSKATQADAAKALIAYLKSPSAAPVYTAKGMEPVQK